MWRFMDSAEITLFSIIVRMTMLKLLGALDADCTRERTTRDDSHPVPAWVSVETERRSRRGLMSTAMTCPSQIDLMMSAGRLLISAPSTMRSPLENIGGPSTGSAQLA